MTGAAEGDGTDGTGEIALQSVLANAARELGTLAAKASEIDTAVGEMLVTGAGAPPPAALLQEVDLVRQSVDCMHILIGNLARQECGACTVSSDAAAEGVYLEATRKGCLGE